MMWFDMNPSFGYDYVASSSELLSFSFHWPVAEYDAFSAPPNRPNHGSYVLSAMKSRTPLEAASRQTSTVGGKGKGNMNVNIRGEDCGISVGKGGAQHHRQSPGNADANANKNENAK